MSSNEPAAAMSFDTPVKEAELPSPARSPSPAERPARSPSPAERMNVDVESLGNGDDDKNVSAHGDAESSETDDEAMGETDGEEDVDEVEEDGGDDEESSSAHSSQDESELPSLADVNHLLLANLISLLRKIRLIESKIDMLAQILGVNLAAAADGDSDEG